MPASICRLSLVALLLAAGTLAACSSDGSTAHRWQSSMLERVPPGSDAKVVVLNVPDPGRLTPSERALESLKRAPGVLEARRGAGENELYALVDGFVDPETLVLSLQRDGLRSWVVRVVRHADLGPAGK